MKLFLSLLLIALVTCAHIEETSTLKNKFENLFLQFSNLLISLYKEIYSFFLKNKSFDKIAYISGKAFSIGKKFFKKFPHRPYRTIARIEIKPASKPIIGKNVKKIQMIHLIYDKFRKSKLFREGKELFEKLKPIYDKRKPHYDFNKEDNQNQDIERFQILYEKVKEKFEEIEKEEALLRKNI